MIFIYHLIKLNTWQILGHLRCIFEVYFAHSLMSEREKYTSSMLMQHLRICYVFKANIVLIV